MSEDPTIQWALANPLAIQIDEPSKMWHSGAARDVLPLSPDEVLVATDTSGLWLATHNGVATPAADLDKPDLWCLAKGVYADDHIYAGGQGLFETDLGVQGVPILNWREIPLTYSSSALGVVTLGGGGGPTTIRTVYRIAVLREDRRIVIATRSGVFWSDIPEPPKNTLGCLWMLLGLPTPTQPWTAVYGSYSWNKAVGLPDVKMGYLGLAAGPPRRGERERSIAVASWGEPGRAAEFYWGEWEGGQLVMHPAKVQQDLGRVWARATTMASCEHHPERMYAISSNDEGFPYALWRSFDAGRSWEPVEPKMVKTPGLNPPHLKFPAAAGNFGNHWMRPNNCIAVSRDKPDVVVVGWRYDGFFVSEDAGASFRRTDESWHAHADVHGVRFDPTDPTGERIYTASDGGVLMAPGLGRNANHFVSLFNRQLATLQFQTWPDRMFYGTMTPNPSDNGVVAGGLQDNGNVSCAVEPTVLPWREFEFGDGHICTFVATGHLLFHNNDEPPSVRHTKWDLAAKTVGPTQIVPVTVADPQLATPNGLEGPVISAIASPRRRNGAGHFMYAVAGTKSSVFAFFSDHHGGTPGWEFIARVPIATGYAITAVASHDGERIFVGTDGGRFFVITVETGHVWELTLPPQKKPKQEEKDTAVHHIACLSSEMAFATFNRVPSGTGILLRVRPPVVEQLLKAPSGPFYGLEVAPSFEGPALFAATDDRVHVSRDKGIALGDSWMLASKGLPRRPHCGDLRYVAQPSGRRFLYLSTYGRSVWRAVLGG